MKGELLGSPMSNEFHLLIRERKNGKFTYLQHLIIDESRRNKRPLREVRVDSVRL